MKNQANWERIVRVGVGVVLVGVGFGVFSSPWNWISIAIGAVALVTGLVGYCPAWAVAGFSTNDAGSDKS